VRWDLVGRRAEEEVRRLISVARRRTFGRGEVVFHRKDPADSLHLIQKGRSAVRIMTPLGETATIAVRGPGDSFGEMALVDESAAARGSARSTRKSTACCWRSSPLR
jgi:CRP-like cAMP-binding protein